MDQGLFIRQHEGVQRDLLLATALRLFIGLLENHWVQTPRVAVELSIEVYRRRTTVRDEQDMFLGRMLPSQQGPGEAQPGLGIGVLAGDRDIR